MSIQVRLELDSSAKLRQLKSHAQTLQSKNREELISIAINHVEKNINERIVALHALRSILEKIPGNLKKKSLTNAEIQKLYHLIKDESEFPVVVYPNQFTVEEVTHEKGLEDDKHKKIIAKDIEENDALLRANASLLIIDFGQETKKYEEIKHSLIKAITAILGNMVGEPNDLFVKEVEDRSEPITSEYFKKFVEALYFIDEKTAKPFMKIFNITIGDFNLNRRQKL